MTSIKSMFAVGVVGAMLALSTACSTPTILTTLNSVVVAADAALAVVTATGQVPAPVATMVQLYLNQVSKAASATATELATADTNAVKSSKVAEIWATTVLPNIPGIPPTVSVAINAVQAAVNAFLGQAGVSPAGVAGAHALASHIESPMIASQVVKPTMHESQVLSSIKHRADVLAKKTSK